MTKIDTNIAALKSLHHLTRNEDDYANAVERLSSGKRINNAGDDAAGASSSKLKLIGSKTFPEIVPKERFDLEFTPNMAISATENLTEFAKLCWKTVKWTAGKITIPTDEGYDTLDQYLPDELKALWGTTSSRRTRTRALTRRWTSLCSRMRMRL